MPDLADGESASVQGSGRTPYILKNVHGVYSCSCPAWRNQSAPIERRSCKHLRKFRGEEAEATRLGTDKLAASSRNTVCPAADKARQKDVPALLLAHAWDTSQDLTGWWLSEKLDGVRCYWTGELFLSRNGNKFHAPDWFTASLPKIPLDGELWSGRQQFQRTSGIVRRLNAGDQWKLVRFVVFDAPAVPGVFETRQLELQKRLRKGNVSYVDVLDQQPCRSLDHLQLRLKETIDRGGEGLMLRQPGSTYVAGRSRTLLKVKVFHDAEAVVVEHLPGTGRHRGRLGAVLVQLANGTRFSVGSGFSDAQRELPPPIGSVITFRFQELTAAGVPRFPTFVRAHPLN